MQTRAVSLLLAVVGSVLLIATVWTMSPLATGADKETGAVKPAGNSSVLKRVFANWKVAGRSCEVIPLHLGLADRHSQGRPDLTNRHLQWVGVPKMFREVKYNQPQSEFWVEGNDHFRIEYFGVPVGWVADYRPQARFVGTFDGKTDLHATFPNAPGKHPNVHVWTSHPLIPEDPNPRYKKMRRGPEFDGKFHDLDGPSIAALLLTFRPLPPVLSWTPDRCRLANASEKSGLIKIERLDPLDRIVQCCWVDPSRNDVVVAVESWNPDRSTLATALSIEFQNDKAYGWVPAAWSFEVVGRGGRTDRLTEATVTKYAINEQFPSETFLPKLPPGAFVTDMSHKTYYVRMDGSVRFVPRQKGRGIDYARVVEEDKTQPAAGK